MGADVRWATRLFRRATAKPAKPPPAPKPPSRRRGLSLLQRAIIGAGLLFSLWLLAVGGFLHDILQRVGRHERQCMQLEGKQPGWYTDIMREMELLQAEIDRLKVQKEALLKHNTTRGQQAQGLGLSKRRTATNLPQPFLFVAVLTTTNSSRRAAVRATWMRMAAQNDAMAKFILTEEERTPVVEAEAALHGDIVFVRRGSGTGYRSIVYKIFLFIEWMVEHVNPKFVLKTDDDAYVDTAAMMAALRSLCISPECADERLYLGMEKRNGEVIVEEGHKWSNTEYFRLTGLKEYAPYMLGGGYVFSMDVARALVEVNTIAPLKFMPNEDATFGFWVMGMNLRRIDHPRAKTAAGHCCWGALEDKDAVGRWETLRIRQFDPICKRWLIMHKVDNADQMHYIHERLQQCPEQLNLLQRAASLARTARKPVPVVHPLETFALTDWKKGYHFFGSFEKTPWSGDGSMMVGLRVHTTPRDMLPTDEAEIGLIPFHLGEPVSQDRPGWDWKPLATTRAWNFQFGASLQWVGASNRYIVYNDRKCSHEATADDLCAVVYDVERRRRTRVLPRPVFNVSPDGRVAASINFLRLFRTRKGFGYAASDAAVNAAVADKCPQNDGLWLMDMRTGESRLLVSLRALAEAVTAGPFAGIADPVTNLSYAVPEPMTEAQRVHCTHWINHPQFNKEGDSIVFIYRIGLCSQFYGDFWRTYTFTISTSGHDLWRLPVAEGSFHDYGSQGRLLVCERQGITLLHNRVNATRLQPPANVAAYRKGMCQFYFHDNRYVLADSGPPTDDLPSHLYIWDRQHNDTLMLGYYEEKDWEGEYYAKAGLQPRFSRDGRYVSFDSPHIWGTGLQMYVIGVQPMKVGWGRVHVQPALPPPRRVLLDLALRSGAALKLLSLGALSRNAGVKDFDEIHSFQAGALSLGALKKVRAVIKQLGLTKKVVLHNEAVGLINGTITINTMGISRYDVNISDVQQIILPHPGDQDWTKIDGKWAPWRGGGLDLPQVAADVAAMEFGPAGKDVEVQALDLSAWLKAHVRREEHVSLILDLEGREFRLLRKLLLEGSLLLVDRIYIHWHIQHLNWEWPLIWEGILSTVGVDFEIIPHLEDSLAAWEAVVKEHLTEQQELARIAHARSEELLHNQMFAWQRRLAA